MEGSNRSAVSDSLCHRGAVASSREESGWTEYLEDFMASEERETSRGSSPSAVSADAAGGSSLVSDAASCALPWKEPPAPAACPLQGSTGFKKLTRRTRLGNDELEDTASSPVSSPKEKDLNRSFDVNGEAGKKDDVKGISQLDQKELLAAAGNLSEAQRIRYDHIEGINEMDFGDQRLRNINNRIELKKKGLRLVPTSMLVHYLG